VVLRNDTTGAITVYRDAQGMPLWLTMASLPLNGYGGSWCDGGFHNDPSFSPITLDPGATLDFDWNGKYVATASTGCYQDQYAAPGTYIAQACAYLGKLGPSFNPLFHDADAGVPDRCLSFAIDLPPSGDATTTLRMTSP
jgi:hypothetical protein